MMLNSCFDTSPYWISWLAPGNVADGLWVPSPPPPPHYPSLVSPWRWMPNFGLEIAAVVKGWMVARPLQVHKDPLYWPELTPPDNIRLWWVHEDGCPLPNWGLEIGAVVNGWMAARRLQVHKDPLYWPELTPPDTIRLWWVHEDGCPILD